MKIKNVRMEFAFPSAADERVEGNVYTIIVTFIDPFIP